MTRVGIFRARRVRKLLLVDTLGDWGETLGIIEGVL
jgi:hypothetical protein